MWENWIELVGRKGADGPAKTRIMTIDIGGGTTDIAVVEYADFLEGEGVNLDAGLLFRDCFSTAGDAIAKEIIESVLLPTLGSRFRDDEAKAGQFESFFVSHDSSDELKAKWSRISETGFGTYHSSMAAGLVQERLWMPGHGIGLVSRQDTGNRRANGR